MFIKFINIIIRIKVVLKFIPKYYTAVRRQRILPGHVRDYTFPNQAR
jgi:hypothetical protein